MVDVVVVLRSKGNIIAHRRAVIVTSGTRLHHYNAMRAGSRIGAHAQDNYGGHKGLWASETAMNLILTVNSIRARRGRVVIMSNNA
jgi:hypothetical protein